MIDITLVVLCAGNSSRFNLEVKKQWLRIGDEPLWLYVTKQLTSYTKFKKIIVVSHLEEINYMKNFTDDYKFITGGNTRQESMKNALKDISTKFVMVTDVARACTPKSVILDLIKNRKQADSIVPMLYAVDSIVYDNKKIDRDKVRRIQTPQLSKTKILKKAIKTNKEFTDDSSAISAIGGTIFYIDGSEKSEKLTHGFEVNKLDCLKKPSSDFFTGLGIDIHKFEENKEMILGGIKIDSPFGFKAHSDGDVVIHSIIDALLGASGAGDIGEFFPDTDEQYKDINSTILLEKIVKFINNVGYRIVNIDLTILAEVPKINIYKNEMRTTLSKILQIAKYKINIKATRGEKMGYIGRAEGVRVDSIATLKYYDWANN